MVAECVLQRVKREQQYGSGFLSGKGVGMGPAAKSRAQLHELAHARWSKQDARIKAFSTAEKMPGYDEVESAAGHPLAKDDLSGIEAQRLGGYAQQGACLLGALQKLGNGTCSDDSESCRPCIR